MNAPFQPSAVSSAVDATTDALLRARATANFPDLINRVRATLQLVAGTLNATHKTAIEDLKNDAGEVTGVVMLGRSPAFQLTFSPEVSTGDAVFHTFPLTDAVLVASLVSLLADALASIPGNPVQLLVGPPMAVKMHELPDGGTAMSFTMDTNEVLDEMVAVADTLPELIRGIRDNVQKANAAAAAPAPAAND